MSNMDKKSASDFTALLDALDLEPVTLEPLAYGEFLMELSEHPERADTAHGLLVRAIESLGEVDIDKEPPRRQKYLRMLKELGYTLYKAFDHVRGSQRIVHGQMQHFRAAAANGYQLFLAVIIKGPPGSGKSMFVDAYKAALEGHVVYSVEGCPVHENPLNLLTLLSPKALASLATKLHLTEADAEKRGIPSLKDMLAVAGDPCQHCWAMVMDNKNEKDPNKALLNLKVVPQRISSRKFGISTWTPNCSLPSALERGSRGMVDMGELFDGASSPMLGGGTSPALKILLDATNDRRIPGRGGCGTAGTPSPLPEAVKELAAQALGGKPGHDHEGSDDNGNSHSPLDTVLFGQTNEGAWKQFIQSLGKDAGKYTRRFHVFNYPYNTSVTEEEQAYRDRIELMRDLPHFDPMALTMLSLLAVISRLKADGDVDVVKRARIYDGEKLEVKRSAPAPVSTGGFGGGWSSSVPTAQTATSPDYWTVEDLWKQAGDSEAMTGLDMTVMFNMLSEIIDRALTFKQFEGCVSSYEMISFLRDRLAQLEKSDGFTEEQREVLKRCREKFLAPAKKGEKPGAIEAEYQRVLQRQLYEIAAPDFDRRAAELFERYKRHANAFTVGDRKVEEPEEGSTRTRKVDVDVKFLNEMDEWIGLTRESDRTTFRASLETEIFKFVREQRQKATSDEDVVDTDITWRTLPRLADGIRKKLNSETKTRLERLLKGPLELQDETADDRRLRDEMFKKFDQLGYCAHCRSQALEYFKLNELWALQG
jgi:predicted Ser/Thr protein kinase